MNSFFRKLREKGFFYIFGASTLNKIIQFCSGIFLVRLISKNDFGIYSQAQNIVNIFVLFIGLGTNYALMQFGSEAKNVKERNSFFNFSFKIAVPFNLIISGLILCYAYRANEVGTELKIVLVCMSLLPMFIYLFECLQIYFRTSLLNLEFSKLSTINTMLIFLLAVTGAISIGIFGIIFASYLAYFVSIGIGIYWLRKKKVLSNKSVMLDRKTKKEFFSYSITLMFSNSISSLVYLIDIFLIGYLIKDNQILANYKAATIIPFALNFIPISIMTFVYPYFAKNRENRKWVLKMYKKLQLSLVLFNFIMMIVLVAFAPLIIRILFGNSYLDSTSYFRVLSVSYFIAASFRIPAGNVLAMMKKIKFLFIANLIVGVANIGLDYYLIQNYSAIGASISTLTIIVVTSIIYNVYLYLFLWRKRK
ncbi:hypothetical protein ATZ35_01565 [Enterococcus rotai]|uniref:Uncharacterized protein n=2 Tax=Enterococcus rotai TaxID=118060 RepID=A0A0U2ITS2_9ENTE|nr:hypothetical protein ATZ35_01565 [Enterococcus rotai]